MMDSLGNKVLERISALIEKKTGGNWRQFALGAGVNVGTLHNTKERETIPSGENLVRIARFGGVTVDWLLTGEETAGEGGRVGEGPAPEYGDQPKTVSVERLTDVIIGVRAELAAQGITLEPKKEAEVIALLYDIITDEETADAKQTIARLVKLVG